MSEACQPHKIRGRQKWLEHSLNVYVRVPATLDAEQAIECLQAVIDASDLDAYVDVSGVEVTGYGVGNNRLGHEAPADKWMPEVARV